MFLLVNIDRRSIFYSFYGFLKAERAQYVTKHVLAYAMSRRLEPSAPALLPWPLVGLPHPADLGAEQSEEPPEGKVIGGVIDVKSRRIGSRSEGEDFRWERVFFRVRSYRES